MYDLIIVGSGPAGLTASIYASCYHMKHLVIGGVLGGQMQLAPDILNFPGFNNISGKELTMKMAEQVKTRGGEIVVDSVVKINHIAAGPAAPAEVGLTFLRTSQNRPPAGGLKAGGSAQKASLPAGSWSINGFEIETMEGKKYQTKAIILATGTERRKLNVPGEIEYTGRGVHYCATCEKFDYAGKVCAVIGGANSAVQAAVELAQAASKVYIIYRGTQLRGDPIWLEQVDKNPNIEVIYNSAVTEIVGDGEKITGLKLKSTGVGPTESAEVGLTFLRPSRPDLIGTQGGGSAQKASLPADSSSSITNKNLSLDKVFIEIGGVPGTALVIPLGVKMDQGGYIEVNERLATNVHGIFAAGDLVSYGLSIEQISSAVGLGARAAASAFTFIKQEKAPTVWGGSQIRR